MSRATLVARFNQMNDLATLDEALGFPRSDEGYRLLSVTAVGLPVWKLPVSCRLLEHTEVELVAEFVLKCIDAETTRGPEIAEFLDLPLAVVLEALATLYRSGHVFPTRRDAESPSYRLTGAGRQLADDLFELRPIQKEIDFHFDALSGRFRRFRKADLVNARQAEAGGLLPLATASGSPPPLVDSDNEAIEAAYAENPLGDKFTFLSVLAQAGDPERLYMPAHLVIAQSVDDEGLVPVVFVDSRSSNLHTEGLLRADLLVRSHAEKGLASDREALETIAGSWTQARLVEDLRADSIAEQFVRALRRVERRRDGGAAGSQSPEPDEGRADQLTTTLVRAEEALYRGVDRWTASLEHDLLLDRAFREARLKVLISLPRLSAAFWGARILPLVKSAAASGVKVVVLLPTEVKYLPDLDRETLVSIELELEQLGCEVSRAQGGSAGALVVDESWLALSSQGWGSPQGLGLPRIMLSRDMYLRSAGAASNAWMTLYPST
jgi:hypothetical protein